MGTISVCPQYADDEKLGSQNFMNSPIFTGYFRINLLTSLTLSMLFFVSKRSSST